MEQNNQTIGERGDAALLGALVVIALIVVGGAYLIQSKVTEIKQQNQNATAIYNSLNDLDSIKSDLNKNSNISDIGKDLQ